MRVLVTGAGGFVGQALVGALASHHEVTGLDIGCSPVPGVRMVEGDLVDARDVAEAVGDGCDVLVHLATVPGGAAEEDPARAWRVNVEASRQLFEAVRRGDRRPRVVFASSIAALGDHLPDPVTDDAPLRPRLYYGAHKAMVEQWLGTLTRRGEVEGLSLRLSGILARPKGQSGMKSAFLSDVFHAAIAGEKFSAPVSAGATTWAMSRPCIVRNLVHAVEMPALPPEMHSLTLPAVRATMSGLAEEVARQAGSDPALVRYAPDPQLEAMFGCFPALDVSRAAALGFESDGSLGALVGAAIDDIRRGE